MLGWGWPPEEWPSPFTVNDDEYNENNETSTSTLVSGNRSLLRVEKHDVTPIFLEAALLVLVACVFCFGVWWMCQVYKCKTKDAKKWMTGTCFGMAFAILAGVAAFVDRVGFGEPDWRESGTHCNLVSYAPLALRSWWVSDRI